MKKNAWKWLLCVLLVGLIGAMLTACTLFGGSAQTGTSTGKTEHKQHTFSNWVVTQAATCTEAGRRERTCSVCKEKETETISATGHTFVDGVCSVCGQPQSSEQEPASSAGLAFTLKEDDAYEVSGYTGTATNVVIPATYENKPVTSIGYGAFAGHVELTGVIIPDSLIVIGEGAFANCTGLTNIIIPDTVTSIGFGAFFTCKHLMSVTIGSSVTSIGNEAFFACYYLSEVYNKSSLDIVAGIPIHFDGEDFDYVGYYAKAIYTESYESRISIDESGYILYTDGDGISLIGYMGTDTALTLPGEIAEIHDYAFYGNETVTSIMIPDSVESIGENAFYYCTGLTSITFTGTMAQWNALNKEDDWDTGSGEYTIHCTDGDIAK